MRRSLRLAAVVRTLLVAINYSEHALARVVGPAGDARQTGRGGALYASVKAIMRSQRSSRSTVPARIRWVRPSTSTMRRSIQEAAMSSRRGSRRACFNSSAATISSIKDILQEAARYLTASPHSRLRQLHALRELDDRLLADVGVTRREALCSRPIRRRDDSNQSHSAFSQEASIALIPTTEPGIGTQGIVVRDAMEADMPTIQTIYAHQVLHGLATFEEVPPTVDELLSRRESVLNLGLPYLTAELNGRVVGFSYATAYRPRPAYRNTIEDSVYVAKGMQGRGVGRALLTALISRCEMGPWRQMIAVIGNGGNAGSISLHERLGFRTVGTLDAAGFKLGRWVDTILMQRLLGVGRAALPDGEGHTDAGA